jgi:hypothetical protein
MVKKDKHTCQHKYERGKQSGKLCAVYAGREIEDDKGALKWVCASHYALYSQKKSKDKHVEKVQEEQQQEKYISVAEMYKMILDLKKELGESKQAAAAQPVQIKEEPKKDYSKKIEEMTQEFKKQLDGETEVFNLF